MKNIVYLIISSMVVLGVISLVITLFRQDKAIVGVVSNKNDQTQNVTADGMTSQGTPTGSDVVAFIRYHEKNNILVNVKFSATVTKTVDSVNRANDISDIISYINSNLYVSTSGVQVSYLEATYKKGTPFDQTQANFEMLTS